MKYYLESASGRRFEVEVEEAGPGRYAVALEGERLLAQFEEVDRLGQYAVRIGARSYAVAIEEQGVTQLAVHLAGLGYRMTAVDQRERDADRVGAARPRRGETLLAPIPGVVVEVRVSAGDRIAAGQAAVVLEAMKMQNEIAPAHEGIVEAVLVEAGQPVAVNAPLVKISPPG